MARAWFRILTSAGRSGVAVLCVDAEAVPVAARALALTNLPAPGQHRVVRLICGDAVLDHALLVRWPDAGGDLEIHCHGGPAVVAAVRAALVAASVPELPAPVATLADDYDRLLAVAIHREAAALVLEQRECGLLPLLRDALTSLDAGRWPDRVALAEAQARARVGRAHFEPWRLALWGATNAGKSSLVNLLVGSERALTGPEPGLTRDIVSAVTVLAGYPVVLLDTPGVWASSAALDREGIARGTVGAAQAAARLLVVDRERGLTPEVARHGRALDDGPWVLTKVDRPPAPDAGYLPGRPVLAAVRCDRPALADVVRRLVGRGLQTWRALPAAGPRGCPVPLSAFQEDMVRDLLAAIDRDDAHGAIDRLRACLLPPPDHVR